MSRRPGQSRWHRAAPSPDEVRRGTGPHRPGFRSRSAAPWLCGLIRSLSLPEPRPHLTTTTGLPRLPRTRLGLSNLVWEAPCPGRGRRERTQGSRRRAARVCGRRDPRGRTLPSECCGNEPRSCGAVSGKADTPPGPFSATSSLGRGGGARQHWARRRQPARRGREAGGGPGRHGTAQPAYWGGGEGPAQALPRAWGPASRVSFCSYRKINPFHLKGKDPHYKRPGKQGNGRSSPAVTIHHPLPPTHAGPRVWGPH